MFEAAELPADAFELPVDAFDAFDEAFEALLDWAEVFDVPLAAELSADCADELPVWADEAPDWFEFAEIAAHPVARSESQRSVRIGRTLHQRVAAASGGSRWTPFVSSLINGHSLVSRLLCSPPGTV